MPAPLNPAQSPTLAGWLPHGLPRALVFMPDLTGKGDEVSEAVWNIPIIKLLLVLLCGDLRGLFGHCYKTIYNHKFPCRT